jgi:hypothetical protein
MVGGSTGSIANRSAQYPPGVAGERRRSAVVEVSSPPIRRQGCATRVSICGGHAGTQSVPVLPMQTGGDRKPLWDHYQKQPALQPPALAKCREINSRRGVPSRRAITGAQLHSDLFVAIRNSQWCTCSKIWQGRSRFDGISLAFPRSLRRRCRLR